MSEDKTVSGNADEDELSGSNVIDVPLEVNSPDVVDGMDATAETDDKLGGAESSVPDVTDGMDAAAETGDKFGGAESDVEDNADEESPKLRDSDAVDKCDTGATNGLNIMSLSVSIDAFSNVETEIQSEKY